jgi:hypothetical protein
MNEHAFVLAVRKKYASEAIGRMPMDNIEVYETKKNIYITAVMEGDPIAIDELLKPVYIYLDTIKPTKYATVEFNSAMGAVQHLGDLKKFKLSLKRQVLLHE